MPKRDKVVYVEERRTGVLSKLGILATVISTLISVAFFLFFMIIIIPSIVDGISAAESNTAIIELEGVISSSGSGFGDGMVISDDIVQLLDEADKDDSIKAVILRINSPGGSPVATEEIANRVSRMNKPVISVIRDIGASGAYWVASSTDVIIASKVSIVGSIGVIGSYVDASGLMTRYNVTYNRIVSGEFKDAGSPFKPMTESERAKFQSLVDRMRDVFIDEVAANRKLPREDVEKMADGFVWLGSEAQQLGLIDMIGSDEEAYELLRDQLNMTVEPVTFSKPPTFLQALMGNMGPAAQSFGKGFGSAFVSQQPMLG